MSAKSIVLKIVAGLLAVGLLLGCIYLLSQHEEAEEKPESIVAYSKNEEDVVSIRVESFNTYTLTKVEGEWVMEGMEAIGVNTVYADTLRKSVCNISAEMLVGEDVNPSDCGFDKPLVSVEIICNDKTESIYVGNPSGEYYYLKTSLDDEVYVVKGEDLYMLFLDKIKYLDNSIIELSEDNICEIKLGELHLVKNGDDWYEKAPYDYMADNDLIKKSVVAYFTGLSATEILKKGDITVAEKKPVTIVTTEGSAIELEIWNSEYIRMNNSEYVYQVNREELANVMNIKGFDLLMKYIAPISITTVSEIELVSPTGKTILSVEAPSSEAPVFYKNGKEAEETSFRSFYQSVMGLQFSKEGEGSGRCEYEIIFTKENGEKYSVKFLNANESEFGVEINSQKGFLINKKAVTDVFEGLKNIEEV